MGALFLYILKSSVCLAGFYLFYRLLLSGETFHRFNRYALLGIFLLSLLIPCYEIRMEQPVVEMPQAIMKLEKAFAAGDSELRQVADTENLSSPETSTSQPWTWNEILLFAYLLGVLFLFSRNLYSFVHIALLLKRSRRTKLDDGVTLVTHDSGLSPFSWMNYIVVSNADLKEGNEEILTHEREHIRHHHSLDLLLAEVAILFQWFNPAAWLFKQELQNIHEYQADEAVINQGIDAKQYQLLLIKKAVGRARFNTLANSFNHSKLKKRITMMLKRKSNPWARLKYLYILPLVAIAVVVFVRPGVAAKEGNFDNVQKALDGGKVTMILDGEEISCKSLEEVEPDSIRSLKVDGNYVYVSTYNGEWIQDFAKKHPDALVILKGKEIDARHLKRSDYIGEKTWCTYGGDESAQFGPKAKNGSMFIGVMSYHYQLEDWKKDNKYLVYSSTEWRGSFDPDSLSL